MSFQTLDELRQAGARTGAADQIAFIDEKGRVRIGTVKIKEIRCGKKGCTKCPHKSYAYGQYREGPKVKSKYFGKAEKVGTDLWRVYK